MAVKLFDSQTTTTAGVKAPASLAKWPEGGATGQVLLSAGAATVQLRAWVAGTAAKEVLATFVLPVADGEKLGDLYDSQPVYSMWDNWDWNVVSISGGGTLTLALVGVGV